MCENAIGNPIICIIVYTNRIKSKIYNEYLSNTFNRQVFYFKADIT